MKITATDLANDSNSVLDRVVQRGETVHVQRHGKTVAEIRPSTGVDREELLRILNGRGFTEADSQQLRQAMDAASEVFGYAGRD